MAIVTTAEPVAASKIYATHPGQVDYKQIRARLNDLAARGGITERDERVLEYLRELNALSLDQVHRLLWPEAKQVTAYQRLSVLLKHQLLCSARVPRAGMKSWGLPPGKVYALGVGGHMWLREEVNHRRAIRHLKRDQVLHDLLVAEIAVRLAETVGQLGESWSVAWTGERAAGLYEGDTPICMPDGLAVVRRRQGGKVAALPFFLELDASREAHGRPSSGWGRKVIGYDRFYAGGWQSHPELHDLPAFPAVAVITHGAQRLLNLAQAILEHRREPVVYYLGLWDDLSRGEVRPAGEGRPHDEGRPPNEGRLAGEDILTTRAWLIVTPDGRMIGQEQKDRQPLLAMEKKKARKTS